MNARHSDVLSKTLEDEIVTGRLRPGERLDEISLATRFGVSRTPIREALRTLESSGLVQLRPRRGATVAAFGLSTLAEMFEAMAELEAICGRFAARRMTEPECEALQRGHEACVDAAEHGDPDDYYLANVRFHELIYDGSHNRYLADQVRALRRRLHPYRRLQLRVRNRIANSLAEHAAVVEAIRVGNQPAAEAALRAHVAIQGERFRDFAAQMERLGDETVTSP